MIGWLLRSCPACKLWAERVKYLEDTINFQRQEWKAERDEYKRTVDRLLEEHRIRPVGQGETPQGTQKVDIANLMDIFKEKDEVSA